MLANILPVQRARVTRQHGIGIVSRMVPIGSELEVLPRRRPLIEANASGYRRDRLVVRPHLEADSQAQ